MLISEDYRQLNADLHETGKYGQWGYREADTVKRLIKKYGCNNMLDYGAGNGTLSLRMPIPCHNYDPALPFYADEPPLAKFDLVNCGDVLEHIEPEYLDNVLAHIKSYVGKVAYFVIATAPDGTKTLPDGRDPHLIVQDGSWWINKIENYFEVVDCWNLKRDAIAIECINPEE